MDILVEKLSKRFNKHTLFKNLDFNFQSGKTYAILGANGSGKSTFLRILSGYQTFTKGKVQFINNSNEVEVEAVYPYISITTPSLQLLEEFTLQEMLDFHFSFKPLVSEDKLKQELINANLDKHLNKQIKLFSSGMVQRTKLLLAFLSDTPLLLLDEPCTNLDETGVDWYKTLVQHYTANRTVIVASNLKHEYDFCETELRISDFA